MASSYNKIMQLVAGIRQDCLLGIEIIVGVEIILGVEIKVLDQ